MLHMNRTEVLETLQAFYNLSGIGIVLFDYDFNQVLSCPEHRAPLCELFWSHPELRRRCIRCDQNGFRMCAGKRTATVYTCHAGLSEAIMPLRIDDAIAAYVMFGQVFVGEDRASFDRRIEETMAEFSVPDDQWKPALEAVLGVEGFRLAAAAKVLEALTLYFQDNRLVSMGRQEFVETINGYIDAHLSESIRVSDLCTEFAVGRTHLYELMRAHFGCGLSDHIQRRRIERAAELLRSTTDPIHEIAARVGFPDVNYFCRIFRSRIGMTAREYRAHPVADVQK